MSRTEGIYLPRLPHAHIRVGSLPVTAQSYSWLKEQTKGLEKTRDETLDSFLPPEPANKGFLGSPRYDLPPNVYSDPVMYEEVFVKEMPIIRKLPAKVSDYPLAYNTYNSLHDPHCREFLLQSQVFRRHLERQGFLTSDLRVVAAPGEQRQRVRAHELLERREMLMEKLRERNEDRKMKLRKTSPKLPKILKWSRERSESREKQKKFNIEKLKCKKRLREIEEENYKRDLAMKEAKRIEALIEKLKLEQELVRIENEKKLHKIMREDYERRYADTHRGKEVAFWRMESDRIHNRIIHMSLLKWHRPIQPIEFLSTRERDTQPASYLSEDELFSRDEGEEAIEKILSEISEGSISPLTDLIEDLKEIHYKPETGKLVLELTPTPLPELEVEIEPQPIELEPEIQTPKEPVEAPRPEIEVRTAEETGSELDHPSETDAFSGEEESRTSKLDFSHLSSVEKFFFIMNQSFTAVDPQGSGTILIESALQVLRQPSLGLFLSDEELQYIGSQLGTNRFQTVSYSTFLPSLPQYLISIYHQRSQQQMLTYNYSFEEVWCQMHHPETGYIYFNKFSSQVTDERPADFRPSLKDDLFEEVIVDLIFMTDSRQDGVIDQEEFDSFLAIQSESGPLNGTQLSDLKDKFTSVSSVTPDGVFYINYSEFVSIAHLLISFLYQNRVPGDAVWVELPSTKVNSFWFNKQTGQTSLTRPQSAEPVVHTPEARRTALGSRPQPLPAIEEVESRPSSTQPAPVRPDSTPTPPSLVRRQTPRRASRQAKGVKEGEPAEITPSHTDKSVDLEIEVRLASKLSSLSTRSEPIREEVDEPIDSKLDNLAAITMPPVVALATQIV